MKRKREREMATDAVEGKGRRGVHVFTGTKIAVKSSQLHPDGLFGYSRHAASIFKPSKNHF